MRRIIRCGFTAVNCPHPLVMKSSVSDPLNPELFLLIYAMACNPGEQGRAGSEIDHVQVILSGAC